MYGYPAFTVTFVSKNELRLAEEAGLNQSFKREIDVLCKGTGPKSSPFSADRGVLLTYQGWLEEQAAKDKAFLAELDLKTGPKQGSS